MAALPDATETGSIPTTTRLFHLAAAFYLIAWAVHSGDHIRRGLLEIPIAVQILGYLQVLLTLGFIWLLWRRHPLGPIVAIGIGVPATIGIAIAHLLPDFGPVSDSLWVEGIDAFTWFAVILEILGTILLTIGGWLAWRAVDFTPPSLRAG